MKAKAQSYGTYVVDEQVLSIVDVQLHDGTIVITAYMKTIHTVTIHHGAEFRIHGDDGVLIIVGTFRNDGHDVVVEGKPNLPAYVTIHQPVAYIDNEATNR